MSSTRGHGASAAQAAALVAAAGVALTAAQGKSPRLSLAQGHAKRDDQPMGAAVRAWSRALRSTPDRLHRQVLGGELVCGIGKQMRGVGHCTGAINTSERRVLR